MDLSPWDFPRARVHHVLRLVLLFRSQLMVFFFMDLATCFDNFWISFDSFFKSSEGNLGYLGDFVTVK